MVYHGKPQGFGSQSLLVNANHPPQGVRQISPVSGDKILVNYRNYE